MNSDLLPFANWEQYQNEVLMGCRIAFAKYTEEFQHDESQRVSQISLFSNPWYHQTYISFGTLEGARKSTAATAAFFRSYQDEETAESVERQGFEGNPASFAHSGYYEIHHVELDGLAELEWEHESALLQLVAAAHREVVAQIFRNHLLDTLFSEQNVWIGNNSDRDGYDDVVLIVRGDEYRMQYIAIMRPDSVLDS